MSKMKFNFQMAFIFSVVLVMTGVLVFGLIIYSGLDHKLHSFENPVEAADTIKGGWIPDILPDSAYEIEVQYDLDSNESHGEFRFKAQDAKRFRSVLENHPEKFDPSHLVGKSKAPVVNYGLDSFYVIVDWSNHHVFFGNQRLTY